MPDIAFSGSPFGILLLPSILLLVFDCSTVPFCRLPLRVLPVTFCGKMVQGDSLSACRLESPTLTKHKNRSQRVNAQGITLGRLVQLPGPFLKGGED
jgi:hypothetical protein